MVAPSARFKSGSEIRSLFWPSGTPPRNVCFLALCRCRLLARYCCKSPLGYKMQAIESWQRSHGKEDPKRNGCQNEHCAAGPFRRLLRHYRHEPDVTRNGEVSASRGKADMTQTGCHFRV